MIRTFSIILLLFIAAQVRAQQHESMFNPDRQVVAILERQLCANTAAKGTNAVHVRLTGHASYNVDQLTGDTTLRDSVRYYYSHGRGMNGRVDETLLFLEDERDYYYYANDLNVAMNSTPYVKIYYDSALWAYVSLDTANVPEFTVWGKYYRGYDSSGGLMRQDQYELNGTHRSVNIVSNNWGQITSFVYPPSHSSPQSPSAYRQLNYNAAQQIILDTCYYDDPLSFSANYFTRYLYDSLGNLIEKYLTSDEKFSPARAYRSGRTVFAYDSLSRLMRVRYYYRYNDSSAEELSRTDSFTYSGNNKRFSWFFSHSSQPVGGHLYLGYASHFSPGCDTLYHYWRFGDSSLNETLYHYRTFVFTLTPENNTATVTQIFGADSLHGLPTPLTLTTYYYDTYTDSTLPPQIQRAAARAHPNPVTASLTLDFENPGNEPVDVNIVDINGRNYVHASQPGGNQAVVQLSHLQPGLYFAELLIGNGKREVKKFIKAP